MVLVSLTFFFSFGVGGGWFKGFNISLFHWLLSLFRSWEMSCITVNQEALSIFWLVDLKYTSKLRSKNFLAVVVDVKQWYSLKMHRWNNDVSFVLIIIAFKIRVKFWHSLLYKKSGELVCVNEHKCSYTCAYITL